MSLRACTLGLMGAIVGALAVTGCIVHDDRSHPGPGVVTEVQFDETQNLGSCGAAGSAFSWTVTNRQTQDTATAYECPQPILFDNLNAGTSYDFDIEGYQGSQLCWQGACNVTATYNATTFADCSPQIQHLCGF